MAHERVGSMIPARKKLMMKVRGEARQWAMRWWVTAYLLKATVWCDCWEKKKCSTIRVPYREISAYVHTWPHPTARSSREVILCLSGFSDLGLFSAILHLCFCEPLTVDRAPMADHIQHRHTPSVLAWEMLRLAGLLLAKEMPTHSDHLVALKCPTWPLPVLSLF